MPGVFSVPKEGLFNVSVDELLKFASDSGGPDRSQDEIDEDVCKEALAYLETLDVSALQEINNPKGAPFVISRGRNENFNRVKALLDQLPDGPNRRKVIHKLRRHMASRSREWQAKKRATERNIEYLRSVETGVLDLREWGRAPPKLERPDSTIMHQFRDSLAEGLVSEFREVQCAMTITSSEAWSELAAQAEVFIVQHNWAAAFTGAVDYDFGEIHLPAECCAFEFRVSGRPVIAFATEVEQSIYIQHAVRAANGRWFIYDMEPAQFGGASEPVFRLVAQQIRAIVIALDAAVAETTVIRAPHKLNAAREHRGKLPIASYHVVSLANRSRVPRLERETDEPPSHHKRLHFRRGHWRHFESWKTWIRWTLVGDPDLGFVDKHYRL